MEFLKTDNGNLKISLEGKEDREELATMLARWGGNDIAILADMLEYTRLNGNGWGILNPEDIGALTESPILTDDYSVEDDGTVTVHPESNVWWFPNYMVENFAETLARDGFVIFTLARA